MLDGPVDPRPIELGHAVPKAAPACALPRVWEGDIEIWSDRDWRTGFVQVRVDAARP